MVADTLDTYLRHFILQYPISETPPFSAQSQIFTKLAVWTASETGSWTEGFTPTKAMGTRLDDGVPVNSRACTLRFDSTKLNLIFYSNMTRYNAFHSHVRKQIFSYQYLSYRNDSDGLLAPPSTMLSENLTTQTNRTLKIWWPEYLECVLIEGSLAKVGMERTKQWN